VEVTDVYFPEKDPLQALFYPGPRSVNGDAGLAALAQALAGASAAQPADNFTVTVPATQEDGTVESWLFRAQRAKTMKVSLLIFRRLAGSPPDLAGLLPKTIVDVLAHRALCKGGLLVLCGGPGQGKTTTLAATVAARLRAFGGLCVAAEDPPEIPLEGRHGDGMCLQMAVTEDYPLEKAIHTAMRMFPVGVPTLCLVGEVRSREAADEALNAALNGTLVCMTLHASSQVEALHRLVGLAGGGDQALNALAASLRVLVHQRLVDKIGGGKEARLRPLVVPEIGGESIRGNIRKAKFELLSSDIESQERMLAQGKPIPL
jgi:twitching motility protein PilT